jgi:protease-4
MVGIYDLFLRRVSEGRKLPVEKITPSAEGQIFSGREGKNRGLVDEIGGLTLAIAKAKELAKLPDDAKIVILENRPSLLELLGDSDDESVESKAQGKAAQAKGAVAASTLDRLAPEARALIEALEPLSGSERVVLTAPYAVRLQ